MHLSRENNSHFTKTFTLNKNSPSGIVLHPLEKFHVMEFTRGKKKETDLFIYSFIHSFIIIIIVFFLYGLQSQHHA